MASRAPNPVGLTVLDNCQAVLNYYQENALKEVTPWGLGDNWGPTPVLFDAVTDAGVATTQESDGGSTINNQPSYSATNIQVAGVDEADIVKTDGNYIYLLNDQTLEIVDIRQVDEDSPPVAISQLEVSFYPREMLFVKKLSNKTDSKDSLIIVGGDGYQRLRLVQVDISDRKSPKTIADFTIDGNYVGIRLVDNSVRLVSTSAPLGFDWEAPSGSGLRAEAIALEANKEIIKESQLNNWLPAYKDNLQTSFEAKSSIDCSQMLAPKVFSGLNTLSIMSFNASQKLTPDRWQTIGLAADGQDIYATADHVYVATTEVVDEPQDSSLAADSVEEDFVDPPQVFWSPPSNLKTIIHKFGSVPSDKLAAKKPVYLASGQVIGSLLNQFSMDEYQGDLRVAVTVEGSGEDEQENQVKILRANQGILEEIGAVVGLGIDERIFAVRFMGPQAYLVTFRQIDPLYALDLSEPTNPRALGELKITGFSSYLHPVGQDLLLGIGQEASLTGQTEGLQISLFETSDPTKPERVSQLLVHEVLDLGLTGSDRSKFYFRSTSVAEADHRAFVFHKGLSLIPYDINWYGRSRYLKPGRQTGLLVIEVKDKSLSIVKDLKIKNNQDNKNFGQTLVRSIVVGDLIYGISSKSELIVWQASSGQLLHNQTHQ